MTTPSGSSDGKCDHNNFDAGVVIVATCTEKGYTLYTCKTAGCGYSYKTDTVAAKGHSYVDGACTVCKEAEPATPHYVTSVSAGQAYKLGFYSTAGGTEYYFNGTMNGYYGASVTEFDKGVDVFLESATGGYYLYFKNSSGQKQYINLVTSTSSGKTYINFSFGSSASSVFVWDSAKNALKTTVSGEVCYMGTFGTYVTFNSLRPENFKDTDYIARLYVMGEDGSSAPDTPDTPDVPDTPDTPDTPAECEHNYRSVVTAPGCTSDGFTTYTCTLCGDTYMGNTTSAKGHSYVDGKCTVCGMDKPTSASTTISFADTANRTELSGDKQVWVMNGVTVTNNKAGASSSVADYVNPVRFYQGSDVIIASSQMTKIEINCKGTNIESKHIDPWKNVPSGATVEVNDSVVIITFATPVDSITFTSLAKQARAYSITVHSAGAAEESCTHKNTTVEGAFEASCGVAGHTGVTRCVGCGEVVDAGEAIPAKEHTDGNGDGDCDLCGAEMPGSTTPDGDGGNDEGGSGEGGSGEGGSDEGGSDDGSSENGGSSEGSSENGGSSDGSEEAEESSVLIPIGIACAFGGIVIIVGVVIIIKKRKF